MLIETAWFFRLVEGHPDLAALSFYLLAGWHDCDCMILLYFDCLGWLCLHDSSIFWLSGMIVPAFFFYLLTVWHDCACIILLSFDCLAWLCLHDSSIFWLSGMIVPAFFFSFLAGWHDCDCMVPVSWKCNKPGSPDTVTYSGALDSQSEQMDAFYDNPGNHLNHGQFTYNYFCSGPCKPDSRCHLSKAHI